MQLYGLCPLALGGLRAPNGHTNGIVVAPSNSVASYRRLRTPHRDPKVVIQNPVSFDLLFSPKLLTLRRPSKKQNALPDRTGSEKAVQG